MHRRSSNPTVLQVYFVRVRVKVRIRVRVRVRVEVRVRDRGRVRVRVRVMVRVGGLSQRRFVFYSRGSHHLVREGWRRLARC